VREHLPLPFLRPLAVVDSSRPLQGPGREEDELLLLLRRRRRSVSPGGSRQAAGERPTSSSL